jgi:1,2-diacylglycerol 3-alpha-glucosyltransferase
MDEIYCHFYPMSVIGFEMKKRFSKQYSYFDYGVPPISSFGSPLEKIYLFFFKFFAYLYAKSADNITTISRYLARQYPDHLQSKIVVKYIDIDHRRFHLNIDGSRIRNLYGLKNKPIVLYVGRLSPHKGIHLLIRAFDLCRKQFPRAHLLIVGQSSFKRYKKKLGMISGRNTIYAGFVEDEELPEYYAACTVYASASLWEGYDMPLAEAQACGKPAVVFDVGSHKEVIDPTNGTLVAKKDIDGFARALIEKISHAA